MAWAYYLSTRIGIAIGPRAWFGDRYGRNTSDNGNVIGNHFSGAFGYGIALTSAKNFTVQGNNLIGNTSFIGSRGPNCSTVSSIVKRRTATVLTLTRRPMRPQARNHSWSIETIHRPSMSSRNSLLSRMEMPLLAFSRPMVETTGLTAEVLKPQKKKDPVLLPELKSDSRWVSPSVLLLLLPLHGLSGDGPWLVAPVRKQTLPDKASLVANSRFFLYLYTYTSRPSHGS